MTDIFDVGNEVVALRRIEFRSGRAVAPGDRGVVTKVPGCNLQSPCQVNVAGCVFSAAPGDFQVAPPDNGDATAPYNRSPDTNVLLSPSMLQKMMMGDHAVGDTSPPVQGSRRGSDVHNINIRDAGDSEGFGGGTDETNSQYIDPNTRVPARLVHYIDYIGRWSDGVGKQKLEKLQGELEGVAKRLGEEASAKHEEAAWLQTEMDRWHDEAVSQSRRVANLEDELAEKALETDRLNRKLRDRDTTIERLTREVREKNDRCLQMQLEYQKSGEMLKQTKEELVRFEKSTHQRFTEENDARRQLERKFEDAKAAKKVVDDQVYFKMEELARANQAVQQLENALREGNLGFSLAKNNWGHQAQAQEVLIKQLREEVGRLRASRQRSLRSQAVQTLQTQMDLNDDQPIDTTLEAPRGARDQIDVSGNLYAESMLDVSRAPSAMEFMPQRSSTSTRSTPAKVRQAALERAIRDLREKLTHKDTLITALQSETSDLKIQAGMAELLEEELAAVQATRGSEWRSAKLAVEDVAAREELEGKLKKTEDNVTALKAQMATAVRETENRVRSEDFAAINDLQASRDSTALGIIARQKEECTALRKRLEQLENVASALADVFPLLHDDAPSKGLLMPFLQQFAILNVKTPL